MKTFFKINIECFSKWAQMYDPLLRDYNSSPIFWRVGNLIHVNFSVLYFCFTIAKRCKTLKRHPKCELFRKKHNQISVGDSTGVKTRLLISSAKDRPALGHRMSVVQLQRSQSRDTRLLEEGRARIFQRGNVSPRIYLRRSWRILVPARVLIKRAALSLFISHWSARKTDETFSTSWRIHGTRKFRASSRKDPKVELLRFESVRLSRHCWKENLLLQKVFRRGCNCTRKLRFTFHYFTLACTFYFFFCFCARVTRKIDFSFTEIDLRIDF